MGFDISIEIDRYMYEQIMPHLGWRDFGKEGLTAFSLQEQTPARMGLLRFVAVLSCPIWIVLAEWLQTSASYLEASGGCRSFTQFSSCRGLFTTPAGSVIPLIVFVSPP